VILTQCDVLDEIADQLRPEHFSVEALQNIYKVALRLHHEGREPGPLTISAALGNDRDRGYMTALVARSREYLAEGPDHSVPALAKEVIDLASRRALLEAADKVRALAASPSEVIPTLELQAKLEAVVVGVPVQMTRPLKTAGELALETFAAAEKIYETGIEPGVRSGFPPFDQLVGPMMPGDLIVIGGSTSMGKTALAQQLAFEVSAGKYVLVNSMEMSARQWNDRYISQLTGIPVEVLEVGPYTAREFDKIETARAEVLDHLKMVISDQKGMTPAMIMSNARRVRRRFGLDLLVLDHLQFIKPNNPKKEGPEAIAEVVADIKHMAQLLEVPVILVSHLNRDTNKRDQFRPVLSDLFGSSAIEKDADCVVFVHRLHYWLQRAGCPKDKDEETWAAEMAAIERDAEIIIAKRRRGRGAGSVKVGWDPEKTLFYSLW
jgi:replicative DNA helicase